MDNLEEFYLCDVCGERMPIPDFVVAFRRDRFSLIKRDTQKRKEKSYDLCKSCYNTLNSCIRNMIIAAKKKQTGR